MQNKSPCWSRAALPRITGRCSVDVRSKHHVPSGGRSDQALWTSKVSLQFDGFQLVARSHHNIRVRSDAGSRGNGAIEQDLFKRGAKSWDFRCNSIDVGHDRAGSDDSVSERSGFDEKVYRPCFQINFKSSRSSRNREKKVKEISKKVKSLVRASHLFAKTKEQKQKVGKKLYHTTVELHDLLKNVLKKSTNIKHKSVIELNRLSDLIKVLFPQILHFLTTGFVAPKKIIHLQMSELYSIVRGKAGKSVEFGIKWGINRIDGFVLGFVMQNMANASDKKFCIDAIQKHIELFGAAPKKFGFDRGGHSSANIKKAKALGVKHVGIAPLGQAEWSVSTKMSEEIKCERAQVEGLIGNLKSKKYGFNKSNVKSTKAMIMSGHRSCFGFNLCKALRLLNQLEVFPA